jgi:hypothetical protein
MSWFLRRLVCLVCGHDWDHPIRTPHTCLYCGKYDYGFRLRD